MLELLWNILVVVVVLHLLGQKPQLVSLCDVADLIFYQQFQNFVSKPDIVDFVAHVQRVVALVVSVVPGFPVPVKLPLILNLIFQSLELLSSPDIVGAEEGVFDQAL